MIRLPVFARAAALAAALLGASACASHGPAYELPAATASLVQLEIYDRSDGAALPVYSQGGRQYVVGTPGHEYALRIRNRTGARVLAVTSVDGVNVISGETATPSQSGYVLDAYGSVEILGWRKSLERTAAFFFTDLRKSYAARTGRPDNVGVLGVAVFREKAVPIARRDLQPVPAPMPRGMPETASGRAEAPAGPPDATGDRSLAENSVGQFSRSVPLPSRLGTGHGRNEASRAQLVRFERASEAPAETLVVRYDRRETLAAMGVLPERPLYSRRDPDPFPGSIRFTPDPRARPR